jgi:hypothetical protein
MALMLDHEAPVSDKSASNRSNRRTSYHLDGDLSFNTLEMYEKRKALKSHKGLDLQTEVYWATFASVKMGLSRIGIDEVMHFFCGGTATTMPLCYHHRHHLLHYHQGRACLYAYDESSF